jgi:hypothetical protein
MVPLLLNPEDSASRCDVWALERDEWRGLGNTDKHSRRPHVGPIPWISRNALRLNAVRVADGNLKRAAGERSLLTMGKQQNPRDSVTQHHGARADHDARL